MADTSPDLETDGLPHGYAVEKTVALSPGIRDLIGRIGEAVGPVILETDEEQTAPSAKNRGAKVRTFKKLKNYVAS